MDNAKSYFTSGRAADKDLRESYQRVYSGLNERPIQVSQSLQYIAVGWCENGRGQNAGCTNIAGRTGSLQYRLPLNYRNQLPRPAAKPSSGSSSDVTLRRAWVKPTFQCLSGVHTGAMYALCDSEAGYLK
jgi:hypothetical protein